MPKLTPEGEQIIADLAARYGFSTDAVMTMLLAVQAGGGTQAQFSHGECGGGCQWMRGGMTMVGDMFNNALKANVDGICTELSDLVNAQPLFTPPVQSQNQYQGQYQGDNAAGVSLFVPGSEGAANWWPAELGAPSSTGAQNAVRYAYFPTTRRLAIEHGGKVDIYDTLDHAIGGFGQQQSGDSSLTFTSQHGVVPVDALPRVTEAIQDADTPQTGASYAPAPPQPEPPAAPSTPIREAAPASQSAEDIFSLLERLAELKTKGVITEEDFDAKKADLLSRI